MKDIFKDIDKKFLIAILIIVALLSTIAVYAAVTTEMESKGDPANAVPESGKYITLEDLEQLYDIICCYHGGTDSALPGENKPVLNAGGMSTRTTDSGKDIGRLVGTDEGGETALSTYKDYPDHDDNPFTESSYTTTSLAYYTVKETITASPDNAYILAEMIAETDDPSVFYSDGIIDGYSTIQHAWWVTDDNKGTDHSTVNALSEEATAFNKYIATVLGVSDPANIDVNSFVEQHYRFELDDGTVKEGDVPAPVLNYEPKFNEDANQNGTVNQEDPLDDKVTVKWDSNKQTWTVGPFSINYIEDGFGAQTGGRAPVTFSSITGAKVYTNLGEVPEDKWRFNFLKDQRSLTDDYPYPHENEVFEIEVDFIEGATELKNLHFDFKYMNAGGKYDSLEGTYYTETWTESSKVTETCPGGSMESPCSHGYTGSHTIQKKYWLNLNSMDAHPAQLLAYGLIGARWYNEAQLDFDITEDNEHHGNFKIHKKIVDENGNEVSANSSEKFVFNIYKNGEFYDKVQVRANSTFISNDITWKDGEETPKIRIEEVQSDNGYELVSIEPTRDVMLSDGGTVEFIVKNKTTKHSGRVYIKKEQIGSGLRNMEFTVKLYIDNKVYVDSDYTDSDGTIHVRVGETWKSGEITWEGDKAPSYKVSEVNIPDGAKLVNIENGKGKLLDDDTVKVYVVNRADSLTERGTLKIRKVVPDGISTNQTFTFRIKVGNKEFKRKLSAGETWTQTFYWEKGEDAPEYSVEEINIPDGWEFQEITNESGTLQKNKTIEVVCKNTKDDDDGYKGRVSITKQQVGTGLENMEFSMKLYIDGEVYIDSNYTDSDGTIKVKVGETWTSGEIKWKYGNSPTYRVEEINIPEGARLLKINNETGKLIDNETVNVYVINSTSSIAEKGTLKVKKNVPEGVTTSDVFTFRVLVQGNGWSQENVMQLKAGQEWTETYYWKKGEEAPEYSIEEVNIPEGWELKGITNASGKLSDNNTAEIICENDQIDYSGRISITKQQIGTGLENMEFTMKLYIDGNLYTGSNEGSITDSDGTITIRPGETWTSDEIKWKGSKAPTYKVDEINIPEKAKLVGIENGTGTLLGDDTVNVYVINEEDTTIPKQGTLTLKKVLTAGSDTSEEFTFKVVVGEKEFTKKLKANQSWTETFTWLGDEAPKYSVEEINVPEGWKMIDISNASGTLEENKTVEVVCENGPTREKSTRISIKKIAESEDKKGVDELEQLEFNFMVRISGTFEYENESIVKGSREIPVTVKHGETWTSGEIKWTGDAPKYVVTEIGIPEGWRLKEMTGGASGTLEDGIEVNILCVNEYKLKLVIDLTMEMAGMVWEDKPVNPEDKNTEDSVKNGKYDAGIEEGIEKVEVYIYKKVYDGNGNEIVNLRSLAKGYEEGSSTEIEYPIYTSIDGIWSAPRMAVPGLTDAEKEAGGAKADYDVEFVYDGQTYKPTDFLVSGTASEFRRATNVQRTKFLNDSMAYEVEAEREAFDKKFETFTGDSAIDENGVTEGYALNENGERTDLTYYSIDSMESLDGNTRKISELQTTTDDGYIRDAFKMPSRTSTGGLTYPFDDKVHLENIGRELNKIEGGVIIKYEYSATYPYLLNINLGLVRRDLAELSTTKDVYSAAVVVNQKLVNYKFNEYIDYESEKYQDYLDLQLKIADANISYKLDLYESDYYYRAKVYEGNEVYGALQDFYSRLGKTDLSDELDLDVFLTYKISLYNNSDSYLAKIKSVVDYFDEDLELVDTDVSKYIQEANGVNVDSETVVAKTPYVIKKGQTASTAWGEQLNKTLAGKVTADYGTTYNSLIQVGALTSTNPDMLTTDSVRAEENKNYYKANIDLNDDELKLAVGEKLEVYLTFKVRTDEVAVKLGDESSAIDDAKSYVRLGTKANVAEIASYTTYYSGERGGIAGKVDKDSAPNNVDIESKNEKSWYEDDTDSAPIITLDLYSETRDVNGMVWEDAETEQIDYNQIIGNGMYDDGERLIGNLTTQMVEKVRVKQADGTYREYDFVWPTDKNYDFLNGKTLEEITGFDSITLTSNSPENTGTYSFKNIPAGNYIVRFTYGDFPADKIDDLGNLIKLEGIAEPQTSDDNSRIPAVYNGQDFKTTAYQADIVGDDGKTANASNSEGYIDNEWYDFTTCKYDEQGNVINHNSDAIDNEARRLEVIAYSRVLNNEITTALATANNYTADHTELYKNTSMFADTAKINLNIENMTSIAGQKVTVTNEATGQSETVVAGGEETRNNLISNYVFGKSDVNGNKGTVNVINYNYVIDAIDMGIEERSNTEVVLDKEIESISVTTNTDDTILKAVYDISYEYTLVPETGKANYKANVVLNDEKSYGTSNLMAQNKDEEEGLQNFRYIYYDDTISQGLKVEVVYKFTVLNVGEVDRATQVVEDASPEQLLEIANRIKSQVYRKDGNKLVNIEHPNVGEYLGSIYYLGKNDKYTQSDIVATTTVRQLIDYVDNDAVFKSEDNSRKNSSWKTVTPEELLEDKVISNTIVQDFDGVKNVVDDKGVFYVTTERNNLILSIDSIEGDIANPGFIEKLVPYAASKENADATSQGCMSEMSMMMTRAIDSEIDDDDLAYDNIAEIVKLENTVGKRDITTIAGNQDPNKGEFEVSLEERDASATELITFTPPYGLGIRNSLRTEMLIVILGSLLILVVGIVVIKKTVLKK